MRGSSMRSTGRNGRRRRYRSRHGPGLCRTGNRTGSRARTSRRHRFRWNSRRVAQIRWQGLAWSGQDLARPRRGRCRSRWNRNPSGSHRRNQWVSAQQRRPQRQRSRRRGSLFGNFFRRLRNFDSRSFHSRLRMRCLDGSGRNGRLVRRRGSLRFSRGVFLFPHAGQPAAKRERHFIFHRAGVRLFLGDA